MSSEARRPREGSSARSGEHQVDVRQELVSGLLRVCVVELYWLRQRRPSWRFQSRRLAYYRPVAEWAPRHPRAVEELALVEPALVELAVAHDRALGRLTDVAAAAHDALARDVGFRFAVQLEELGFRGDPIDLGPDLAETIAEAIVDSRPTFPLPASRELLPDSEPALAARTFWAHAGDRLSAHRASHPQEVAWLGQALDEMTSATGALEAALRTLER